MNDFFTALGNILAAADAAFIESALSISLFPGVYEDDSPAPADITEIEIEMCPWQPDWIQVTSYEHDWRVYLETSTLAIAYGYCRPDCYCEYCKALKEERDVA